MDVLDICNRKKSQGETKELVSYLSTFILCVMQLLMEYGWEKHVSKIFSDILWESFYSSQQPNPPFHSPKP